MTKKFVASILALLSVLAFVPEFSLLAASKVKYGLDTDIPYRSENDAYIASQCRLDVYYPKEVENAPVVVWFHGGGLTKGKKYAPLTYARGDAAPMLIVSGDRELEMNGRYEEQAYFWRMLKLNGMKDVSIYEMQGYSHSKMRHPAMHLVKNFISDHTKQENP